MENFTRNHNTVEMDFFRNDRLVRFLYLFSVLEVPHNIGYLQPGISSKSESFSHRSKLRKSSASRIIKTQPMCDATFQEKQKVPEISIWQSLISLKFSFSPGTKPGALWRRQLTGSPKRSYLADGSSEHHPECIEVILCWHDLIVSPESQSSLTLMTEPLLPSLKQAFHSFCMADINQSLLSYKGCENSP